MCLELSLAGPGGSRQSPPPEIQRFVILADFSPPGPGGRRRKCRGWVRILTTTAKDDKCPPNVHLKYAIEV